MSLLLGLDVGTTSIKSILYDSESGKVMRHARRPTPVEHPQTGWSEHNPDLLWQAVVECIHEAAEGHKITALAISSMAEAGALLDRNHRALSPIIAWYDRRSEPQAAQVEQLVSMEALYRITGQRASPSFGITKLLWLRENLPELYHQGAYWLPVPSYLLYRLTGRSAVDYTIASRTLVFDQQRLDWSGELLDLLRIPAGLFPPVFSGGTPVGTLTPQAAKETGLSENTLCVLGGHDHLCAAFAAGAHTRGAVVDSTGSANALILLLARFLPDAALAERGYASYAYLLENLFAFKGGLKAAGSAVEWLIRLVAANQDTSAYVRLEAEASEGVGRRAGPLWLPHLIGSGTPQGDRFSRAGMIGAQIEHNRGDLVRGMLESLAFWLRHNLEEMRTLTGMELDSISLIGGATRLRLLSQLKADALNHQIIVPQIDEAAATGAALLAGIGAGVFRDPADALSSLQFECTRVDPIPTQAAWYETLYQKVYLPLYEALKPFNTVMENLENSVRR